MTNKVMEIEARIERLQERQKQEVIQEGGAGVVHTAEYFNIEVKLERLYDELDELAEVGQ